MALSNYSDLQSQVASYLARSDLTSQIPIFIQLCEAKLQRKFKDVTSLSDSVTTNWMLTANPDVYLYGALLEAQPYLQDDARIASWAQIFETVVNQVRYPNSASGFTTYTEFQNLIADWLNRPDLANAIPNFINLAQERLYNDVRMREMLKVSTASTTGGDKTIGLPSDFLQMRDLHLETNPIISLIYEAPNVLFRNAQSKTSGLPVFYTVLADEIQFAPMPSSTITVEMLYYAKPPKLSSIVTSNVFLEKAPELLMYATLGMAAPYLNDDARLQTWAALYQQTLSSLNNSTKQGEYGASPLAVTTD
jgi:hypothetical protein